MSLHSHYVFHISTLERVSPSEGCILKQDLGLQCGHPSAFDGNSSQLHQLVMSLVIIVLLLRL